MTQTWLKAGRAGAALGDAGAADVDGVGPEPVGEEALADDVLAGLGTPGLDDGLPGPDDGRVRTSARRSATMTRTATAARTTRPFPERRGGVSDPFSAADRRRRACRRRPG
jgi:hypothetical protein